MCECVPQRFIKNDTVTLSPSLSISDLIWEWFHPAIIKNHFYFATSSLCISNQIIFIFYVI